MPLHIPDKWLKTAFIEQLGKDFTEEKMAKLERLDWSEYRAEANMKFGAIYDLTGVELCKNLRELSLDGNAVQSLVPIQELVELEEIWLVGSGLTSVSDLSKLRKLKKLVLDMNYSLKDISGIRGLPELTYLNITSTSVPDLSVLETLPKLNELSLYSFKGDLSANSVNRNILIKLLQKGVQLKMREAEELKAEAIATMPESSEEGDLLAYLRSQGGFKLAGMIEAEGINGQSGERGNTPLHHALASYFIEKENFTDQFAVVKRLLAEGADISMLNNQGYSPLMFYLENNREADVKIVALLLENGANPNLTELNKSPHYANLNHAAPLVLAANSEKREIVDFLIDKGADFTVLRTLCTLAKYGYEQYVKIAIEERAFSINEYDEYLGTLLHAAVFGKQTPLVKCLIEKGADVNACNESGRTPLFEAWKGEDVQLLIDAGAAVDAVTQWGDTPFLAATSYYKHDAAKVLANNGANVNYTNKRGKTMLHLIVIDRFNPQDSFDVIKFLVEKGADLDILDDENMTVRDVHKGDAKKVITKLGGKTGKTVMKEKGIVK